MREVSVIDLLGLTMVSVVKTNKDEIVFESESGRKFRLFHSRDCCESVYIESIVGDLNDLVGVPLLLADEVCSGEPQPQQILNEFGEDSFTWTFYKFATVKGFVDVRWYGESNGYYSESVDFEEITD
jgi:hypothetical protein